MGHLGLHPWREGSAPVVGLPTTASDCRGGRLQAYAAPLDLVVAVSSIVAVLSAVPPAAVHAAERVVYPAQPYLAQIGRPPSVPPLRPVKVAVVDTAVDGEHPDLAGRIVAARAFGGGDSRYPASPHGTAVAGLIAAVDANGVGIDGIAPNARLLVADVAEGDSQRFDPGSIARDPLGRR
jgi:Subtilase family